MRNFDYVFFIDFFFLCLSVPICFLYIHLNCYEDNKYIISLLFYIVVTPNSECPSSRRFLISNRKLKKMLFLISTTIKTAYLENISWLLLFLSNT